MVANAVYHITHWKAGSQWIQRVLADLQPARIMVPTEAVAEGSAFCTVRTGAIYSPLYLNRLRFGESPFAVAAHRKFLVIRDLRDVLVSWYFSLLQTHGENPVVLRHRDHLRSLGQEAGLHYLLDHQDFYGLAMISATWLDAPDILTVRFEEIVEAPVPVFARICDYCRLEVDGATLERVLNGNSFPRIAGRPRGSDGPPSHYRRGVAGDWENYFTESLRTAFSRRYDDLVWRCGYQPILPPGHWRARQKADSTASSEN